MLTLIGMSLLILQKKNTNNKTIFKKLIFSTKVWILSFLKVKCQDTLYSVSLGIDGGFSIIYADVWPLDSWSSISQPESVDLGSFYILLLLVLNGFVKTHTWISLNCYMVLQTFEYLTLNPASANQNLLTLAASRFFSNRPQTKNYCHRGLGLEILLIRPHISRWGKGQQ